MSAFAVGPAGADLPQHLRPYTVLRPTAEITHEIERRRSLFRTHLRRADSAEAAQSWVEQLRKAHPGARHHCSAWVIGADRLIQRALDDGEPSGTAGAPILAALLKSEMPGGDADLSDVVAVVLRWFGGTLLGPGGLVSAYSDSVTGALTSAREQGQLRRREHMRLFDVQAPITEAGRWENELRAAGTLVTATDYSADGAQARIRLSVPDTDAQIADLHRRVASLSAGAATPEAAGQRWVDQAGPR
ncbi:YigZ family protein [Nesterenkonia sp. LB17]|uniref:IMPACT family protein n=1 Tax=unclassified Nesterenkonia TaxID=2629769 RepID=UPI001F4CDA91|nr:MULTISPECIES: YigZ family protein [unclassified Nesterenkonia]MCH8561363.1 YigZ family protein [Nesterenkonia sp. DZ6]MCH8565241.1 YigZ family protein [Nesterenkonia sp. LB17]MCH8571177.1 YigZ family protein [Nesterenkonia sp. AY15]